MKMTLRVLSIFVLMISSCWAKMPNDLGYNDDDSHEYWQSHLNSILGLDACRGGCVRGPQGPVGPIGPPLGLTQFAYLVQSIVQPGTVGTADAKQTFGPLLPNTVRFDPDPILTSEFSFTAPDTVNLPMGLFLANFEVTFQTTDGNVTPALTLLRDGVSQTFDQYTVTVNQYDPVTGINRFTTVYGQSIFTTDNATNTIQLAVILPPVTFINSASLPASVSASLSIIQLGPRPPN